MTKGDRLAKAVEAVLERVDECPADECGVNLILDILRPAFNDYVAGEPKPDIERK